jgi:NCAIR mutase (PurE)-related protein
MMQREWMRDILSALQRGDYSLEEALEQLRGWPVEDLGFARLDHQRELRRGFPEVIFGQGKRDEQVAEIFARLAARTDRVLATRTRASTWHAVCEQTPGAQWDEISGCIWLEPAGAPPPDGVITVVCAGTADLPVAREAALTARLMGNEVAEISDVGVAGLHRLLAVEEQLRSADVLIVVAGMEGALPSVVAGLVASPVIGVPTSVGYGSGAGGQAALLGMLNSCASGLVVVNIDNGFGAGYAAGLITCGQQRGRTGDVKS